MPLTILPTAGQSLNATRDPIRNNFNMIENSFIVDHVDYGIAHTGKHNQVTIPPHIATPAPALNEMRFINLNYGVADTLYLQKPIHRVPGPAVTIDVPASAAVFDVAATAPNIGGWTFLPSGIFLYWGQSSFGGIGAGQLFTLPGGWVAPHNLLTAMLWPIDPGQANDNIFVSIATAMTVPVGNPQTQFIVNVNNNTTFGYLVIGY